MATIKQLAEEYTFNIESEYYHIIGIRGRMLWKDKVEDAFKAGGYAVLEELYHIINQAFNEVQEGKLDDAVVIINRVLDKMHELKEGKDKDSKGE